MDRCVTYKVGIPLPSEKRVTAMSKTINIHSTFFFMFLLMQHLFKTRA